MGIASWPFDLNDKTRTIKLKKYFIQNILFETQISQFLLLLSILQKLFKKFLTLMKVSSLKYLLFFLWFPRLLWAENIDSLLMNTDFSLITCDPGDEIYSLFGHSAIRVKNETKGIDIVYNYGTFDFQTPNFTIKFMRGKLPYKLTAYGFDRFLDEYNYYKRGVREQLLNINTEQKKALISFLENNIQPENAEYKYDFFFDNCSSRIRDVFETTCNLDQQYKGDTIMTYRDQLHQYQKSHPWIELGIDMIIGSKADKTSNVRSQMFLPDYLHDNLKHVKKGDAFFLEQSKALLTFEDTKLKRNQKPLFRPLTANILIVVLFVILLLLKKEQWIKIIAKTWYFIAGTGGLVIIFLWFFTDHLATKDNWNILWLNPLFYVLILKTSAMRNLVKLTLSVTSIIALLNCGLHIIPQKMPYLSCLLPAFVIMMYYEWLSPLKKNKIFNSK